MADKRTGSSQDDHDGKPAPRKDGWRETVESVVIAFILAFLFRTFEAEAFVIPTGSMATTLLGRHKEVTCEKCGYFFRVSASDECDKRSGKELRDPRTGALSNPVRWCTCPNCRHTMEVGPTRDGTATLPSYKGDRILVGKFQYQFSEPEQWDVVVFKYPEEAETNYIKRLVGLPDRTLKIWHGDIYTRPAGAENEPYAINRKPPERLLAILQVVHDNNYVADELVQHGWPQRWRPVDAAAWQSADDGVSFAVEPAAGESWLRYHHVPPGFDDWKQFDPARPAGPLSPRRHLITDFAAYNTDSTSRNRNPPSRGALGWHWVGDLAVEATTSAGEVPAGQPAEAILELVEGGRRFQCRIDLSDGLATLSIDGDSRFGDPPQERQAATPFRAPGEHHVLFANCDDRLYLWVDGSPIEFPAGAADYSGRDDVPTRADLLPVGIAARGAALRVTNLRVLRDLYYIAAPEYAQQDIMHDYELSPPGPRTLSVPDDEDELARLEAGGWQAIETEWQAVFRHRRAREFKLGPDQFLMLGDNSGESLDSRLWQRGDESRPRHAVNRDLLIGKAMVIFWPHAYYYVVPNVERMQRIR
jgi:signal peptidase I